MNGVSSTSSRKTSIGISSATSSRESAAGRSRSKLQEWQTDLFGQEVVHVSHSQQQENKKEPKTSAISGPNSSDSSPSAALQRYLASRLRARLEGYGSMEYELIWKDWDMQSGPPICALRASVRRTNDSGFSGWATPTRNDATGSGYMYGGGDHSKVELKLCGQARVAGIAGNLRGRDILESPAWMEKRGALNPELTRWLMGYPEEWCQAAILAYRGMSTKRKKAES